MIWVGVKHSENSLVCDFVEYVLLLFIVKDDRNGPSTRLLPVAVGRPDTANSLSTARMASFPAWHDRQRGRILFGVELAQRGAHSTPAHRSPSSICRLLGYPHCSAVSPPHHHSRLHLPSPIMCTS